MGSTTSPDRNVDRRDFLKTGVAAAIGSVAVGIASGAALKEKTIDLAETIPIRVLGKTGVKLPILGYGGAGLVKIWGNPLSPEDRVKLVRYAILIHGTPGLEQMSVKEAMKVHGELVKLRDEGAVRFIGFSAHSYFDKALALIESGGFDLCMLSYGYIPRGYNQIWTARMTELRNACVAKAHELGMGIVAMKVVGGGVLGAWAGYVVPGFASERRGRYQHQNALGRCNVHPGRPGASCPVLRKSTRQRPY